MKNKVLFIVITTLLWLSLPAMLLVTSMVDGKWPAYVFLCAATTLVCMYGYRKTPTKKNLKKFSMTAVLSYLMNLVITYFIGK